MKSLKKKIIIYLSAMTLILIFLSVMVSLIFPALHVSPAFPYILIFYYIVTLIIILILGRSMQKRIRYFVNSYMLATVIKLILFTMVVVVYLVLNKKDAVSFVITFFVYYLFYSIFEVIALRQLSDATK